MSLTETWSRLTPGQLTAAALTPGGAVLGDDRGLLAFVSAEGEVVAEQPLPAPILDLDAAGDLVAAACGDAEVVLLEKGESLFRFRASHPVRWVRLGPLGDYLLALGLDGRGTFVNRFGRAMNPLAAEEGAESVAIVPACGTVVTVSRAGVVTGFTPWGKPRWRVDLRRQPGAISTDDRGTLIVVPVMAYGAEALTAEGREIGAYDVGEPIRAATVSGDGETILLGTSENRLVLMKKDATVVSADLVPATIESVRLSRDGKRALVRSASGYAHLLAVAEQGAGPLLELRPPSPAARPRYRLKKSVFSPFSMVVRSRLAFSHDSSFVAVGGDRRRIQVYDLDGNAIASRRYGGTLLDLTVTPAGDIRVFASQSVFRFRVDEDGSIPEWVGASDLSRVLVAEDGSACGLSDDGFVIRFTAERGNGERRFSIPDPDVRDFGVLNGSYLVTTKGGAIRVYDGDGARIGESGPWSIPPALLATTEGVGSLCAVKKLLLLIGPDGEERWRHHLPAPARCAVSVPGAFLVVDETGTAHIVTATGVIRRAFQVAGANVVPYRDAGEGPGFLLAQGGLVTAVGPGGAPRWRFRTPDEVAFLKPSPDGRFAGAFAGIDLYVFPLLRHDREASESPDAHRYLEFADG